MQKITIKLLFMLKIIISDIYANSNNKTETDYFGVPIKKKYNDTAQSNLPRNTHRTHSNDTETKYFGIPITKKVYDKPKKPNTQFIKKDSIIFSFQNYFFEIASPFY